MLLSYVAAAVVVVVVGGAAAVAAEPWTWEGVELAGPGGDVQWNGVTWCDSFFVAVGTGNEGNVMTSHDRGATWILQAGGPKKAWQSVACGSDGADPPTLAIVAVSHDSTVFGGQGMVSTDDGATWTLNDLPTAAWQDVVYGASAAVPGTFVAVAASGKSAIATSSNGTVWTDVTAALAGRSADGKTRPLDEMQWHRVAFGADTFVAIALPQSSDSVDSILVITSTDAGATWTGVPTPGAWVSERQKLRGLAFASGEFVACCAVTNNGTSVALSATKGTAWTFLDPPIEGDRSWAALASDGGSVLVATASTTSGNSLPDPAPNRAMHSDDGGLTWAINDATPTGVEYKSVAYGAGVWVAVSSALPKFMPPAPAPRVIRFVTGGSGSGDNPGGGGGGGVGGATVVQPCSRAWPGVVMMAVVATAGAVAAASM